MVIGLDAKIRASVLIVHWLNGHMFIGLDAKIPCILHKLRNCSSIRIYLTAHEQHVNLDEYKK